MKRFILLSIMLGMLFTVFANPIVEVAISRFWFNDQGELKLQFSEFTYGWESTSMDFFDGTSHYTLPIDLNQPVPYIITAPSTNLSPLQGQFCATVAFRVDEVHWGPGLENDLSSLTGTQCGVQTLVSEFENSYWVWAKDYSPTSGNNTSPAARSDIDVYCFDFSGSPLPGIPVYDLGFYWPVATTLADGHAAYNSYCAKKRIRVKYFDTQEVICDTTFFAEPGQFYPIEVFFFDVANDDPVPPLERGNFTIYPTVLCSASGQSLHLDYDVKLLSPAQAELYNLKGRLLGKQDYKSGGTDWLLPDKLPSGVYFLRLNSQNQNLGNQKLIILK